MVLSHPEGFPEMVPVAAVATATEKKKVPGIIGNFVIKPEYGTAEDCVTLDFELFGDDIIGQKAYDKVVAEFVNMASTTVDEREFSLLFVLLNLIQIQLSFKAITMRMTINCSFLEIELCPFYF